MTWLACPARSAAKGLDLYSFVCLFLVLSFFFFFGVSANPRQKNKNTCTRTATLHFDNLLAANHGHSVGPKKSAPLYDQSRKPAASVPQMTIPGNSSWRNRDLLWLFLSPCCKTVDSLILFWFIIGNAGLLSEKPSRCTCNPQAVICITSDLE